MVWTPQGWALWCGTSSCDYSYGIVSGQPSLSMKSASQQEGLHVKGHISVNFNAFVLYGGACMYVLCRRQWQLTVQSALCPGCSSSPWLCWGRSPDVHPQTPPPGHSVEKECQCWGSFQRSGSRWRGSERRQACCYCPLPQHHVSSCAQCSVWQWCGREDDLWGG